MRRNIWILIPLFVLSMGLFSCTDMVDKVMSVVFPSPWGISGDAPLGTLKKAGARLQESGFRDDGNSYDLNLEEHGIDHGTVYFFVPANDEEATNIIVIADGEIILAIKSAFKDHPPTKAKGLIHELWKDLSGSLPDLEVTRGASDNQQALWTGSFSTDTVTGVWASEGLLTSVVSIVRKEYVDKL